MIFRLFSVFKGNSLVFFVKKEEINVKFKIGDRVRCVKIESNALLPKKSILKKEGVVIDIQGEGFNIGVCFDDDIGGHEFVASGKNCNCKKGHGWYVSSDWLVKIGDSKTPKNNNIINWFD